MGIAACIVFGIMAAWITRSFLVNTGTGGYKAVLVIGVIGGLAGLSGILIGWGDIQSFNLYNVLLSIAITAVFMVIWAKLQPRARLTK